MGSAKDQGCIVGSTSDLTIDGFNYRFISLSFYPMSIEPSIPEIWLFQKVALKIQG